MTNDTQGPLTEPVIGIAGSQVALGPLRRDLVELYDRWLNDPEVAIPYFRARTP